MRPQILRVSSLTISGQPFLLAPIETLVGAETAKFPVTLERDEDGFIVASCPVFLGCHSQGKTKEEAIANITEAIRGYVASMRKHGEPVPVADVELLEITI